MLALLLWSIADREVDGHWSVVVVNVAGLGNTLVRVPVMFRVLALQAQVHLPRIVESRWFADFSLA